MILFVVLVQMNFIQRNTRFSTSFKFEDFFWMLPRAAQNVVADHSMQPASL